MLKTRQEQLIAACLVTIVFLQYDILLSDDALYSDPPLETVLEALGVFICTVLSALAVWKRDDEVTSTVLYSCGIVAYNILSEMTIDITKSAVFFYLVLVDIVNLLSIPCIFGLWAGYRHNLTRLRVFTGISIVSSLLPWFIESPGHISIFDESLLYYIPSIIALSAYVVYTGRPDIADPSPAKQLGRHMTRVEAGTIMAETSYMAKREADMILGLTDDGWTFFGEGPVEKSCMATVIGGTRRRWYMSVRKYRGEEYPRAIISPNAGTGGDYGLMFEITHYHFHSIRGKEIVRIYGRNGFFIELYTEDPELDQENMVSRQFDKLIKEF